MVSEAGRKRTRGDIRRLSGRAPFLFILFVCITSHAQERSDHPVKDAADAAGVRSTCATDSTGVLGTGGLEGQHDAYDALKMLFHWNISSSDTTTKGKGKLYVAALPAIGYSLDTKFAVGMGANAALYTDDIDSVNLSAFRFDPTYTFKHQIVLPVQSNIWSSRNDYNFLGNWVYFKFPEMTYGLGGHTSDASADQLDYHLVLLRQSILRKITTDLYAGIGYNLDYHWGITEGGLSGGEISDFQRYGKTAKSVSSGFTLNVLYDSRQNPINPPSGYYAAFVYRNNSEFLGSDGKWQSIILDLRRYYPTTADHRNVLAFWSYDWFVLHGNPPYLDLPATAKDESANQGRGYIQGRFRGRNLISFDSEYRFGLTRDGLFGGVVFANFQSVSDWPGNRFTVFYPALGCGIRFKMNKFSGTNVALDYAFGLHGSRGVFVNLGEVF